MVKQNLTPRRRGRRQKALPRVHNVRVNTPKPTPDSVHSHIKVRPTIRRKTSRV
jgi:hypothetical protein